MISADDIRGDLYELCRGDVAGRTDDDAITLFENGGGGHLDLMAARFAWSRYTGYARLLGVTFWARILQARSDRCRSLLRLRPIRESVQEPDA